MYCFFSISRLCSPQLHASDLKWCLLSPFCHGTAGKIPQVAAIPWLILELSCFQDLPLLPYAGRSLLSCPSSTERGDFVIVNSHFLHENSKARTVASTWVGKEGADLRMFQLWRMSVTDPRGRSGAVLHFLCDHLSAESFPGLPVSSDCAFTDYF